MPSSKLLANRTCDDNRDVRCWKAADSVYGIDNTKTRFTNQYVIELCLSDNTLVQFTQPVMAGWTEQIELWATEIQALLPGCIVSPRCNTPAGCGGLLPPPDGATLPRMFARYVSIICCPGAIYPKSATIVEINGEPTNRPLVMDGGQTPEIRGWMCVECEEPVEFFDENMVPLEPQNIPTCWFECGEAMPGAGETDCTWEWQDGCDNKTEPPTPIKALWKTDNKGVVTFDGYFVVNNDGALDPYPTLGGQFVNCTTGEPIEPPCTETMCDLIDVLESMKAPGCDTVACLDYDCASPQFRSGTINTSAGSTVTTLSVDGTNILTGPVPATEADVNAAIAAAGFAGQIEAFTNAAGALKVRNTQPCGPYLTGLSGRVGDRQAWFSLIAIGIVIDPGCVEPCSLYTTLCNVDELATAIACAMAGNTAEDKPHIVVERICVKESVNGESVLVPKLVSLIFNCRTGVLEGYEVNDMPAIPNALDCCTGTPIGAPIDG